MSDLKPRKIRVATVLVDRANYGRMKPVMQEIRESDNLELLTIVAGTMVLERFNYPAKIVEADGFKIHGEVFVELEGSNPTTMAKSLGFSVIEFTTAFQLLKPDIVLVIGDRYEALGATLAASYMNICIAHIQGGEVSGSIDESARHCMTKLAQFHFPATKRSADYIVRMGENPDHVKWVGCPSGDLALNLNTKLADHCFQGLGSGIEVDPLKDFLLVAFHPVTTEYGDESRDVSLLLNILNELQIQTIWLWPNIDAGSDHVSKTIRLFRERHDPKWLQLVKNFPPEEYLKILANCACAIGNSSSFVRDSSFFGTPVVLTGDRQEGREHAENVLPTLFSRDALKRAITAQLKHGRYAKSNLYGSGDASRKIRIALENLKPYVQKRLGYIYEGVSESQQFSSSRPH